MRSRRDRATLIVPMSLHFQRFSVSEFQFLPLAFTPRGGTNVGTGRKFPKKVLVPAYSVFACALKTRRFPSLKSFRGIQRGARDPLGVAEADRAFVTI
jgi:hypothetical protein